FHAWAELTSSRPSSSDEMAIRIRLDQPCGSHLAGVPGLAKAGHAGDADFLHRLAGRLQVVAGVELVGRFLQHLANRGGDRYAAVGIDVDLPHAVFDP